jgi:hypothetical protein
VVVMMVVVVMGVVVMVVLRKSGPRKEHDHGKQQSLFHVQIIATKVPSQGCIGLTFG